MLALCKHLSRRPASIQADSHLLIDSQPLNTFYGYLPLAEGLASPPSCPMDRLSASDKRCLSMSHTPIASRAAFR